VQCSSGKGQIPRTADPVGDAFLDCMLAPAFTCFGLPMLDMLFAIIPTIITGIISCRMFEISMPPACWGVDCRADIEPTCCDRIIGSLIVVDILFSSMGSAESKLLQKPAIY
jgi:hypothetical protein